MALPRSTRKNIESQNFDAVEDEWLTRLADEIQDISFFTSTARSLDAVGASELATQLLELLDDQLREYKLWEERLKMLEATGEISSEPAALHAEILVTLDSLHQDSTVAASLQKKLGLDKAVDDIPRTWDKVRKFRLLMAYDVGAIVMMQGKGVGRVVDVNVTLEKLRVDFEKYPGLSVGFGAARKVLSPLPPEHFLRRKLEAPEVLRELATREPPNLLKLLLESVPDLTASDIRDSVSGVVKEGSWTSWWTKARNHPQLVATGKGVRQKYRWAETTAAAGEEVLGQFAKAPLAQRLEILKREAKRNPDVAAKMAADLARHADSIKDKEPGEAIEIVHALERAGMEAGTSWTIDELLTDAADPLRAIKAISDRSLRRGCYQRIRKNRDDWVEFYVRALSTETDSKTLEELFARCWVSDRQATEDFVERLLSQPQKQPVAFLWLMARLDSTPYFGDRNPARALTHLLRLGDLPEFASHRVAIGKLIEDGGATLFLIKKLESDQAERVAEMFERAHLEEYLRERLVTALELRFPETRKSVSNTLYALRSSIESRRTDLKRLLEEEIPANRKAIEEARALGDLRENFEYKSARQRHEYLSARVSKLDADLARAQPIDFDSVTDSEIRIGARATLVDDAGATSSVTILGPWESEPDSGILSYESEAGGKLMGQKPGSEIDFAGQTWQIDTIEKHQGADDSS